jgi:hypothetical protein
MSLNITLGDALTLLVLVVSSFNAWQHLNTKNKILELKLWIKDNFVSRKEFAEYKDISGDLCRHG